MGTLRFDLSQAKVAAAANGITEQLTRRHGPAAQAACGVTSGIGLWLDGTLFASVEGQGTLRVVWREGGKTGRLGFLRDPAGDSWAQLSHDEVRVPRLVIPEPGEGVPLLPQTEHLDRVVLAFRAGPRAAYFFSRADLASLHTAREGSLLRACELCGEPVAGGQTYVERYHRQGGDNRRAHLACGQRAWDVAQRASVPA